MRQLNREPRLLSLWSACDRGGVPPNRFVAPHIVPPSEPQRTAFTMLFELSITPLDGGDHIADQLAKVIEILASREIPHILGPSSTTLEGSWDDIMPVLRECHETVKSSSVKVITTIKIEDDGSESGQLHGNIASVESSRGAAQ